MGHARCGVVGQDILSTCRAGKGSREEQGGNVRRHGQRVRQGLRADRPFGAGLGPGRDGVDGRAEAWSMGCQQIVARCRGVHGAHAWAAGRGRGRGRGRVPACGVLAGGARLCCWRNPPDHVRRPASLRHRSPSFVDLRLPYRRPISDSPLSTTCHAMPCLSPPRHLPSYIALLPTACVT